MQAEKLKNVLDIVGGWLAICYIQTSLPSRCKSSMTQGSAIGWNYSCAHGHLRVLAAIALSPSTTRSLNRDAQGSVLSLSSTLGARSFPTIRRRFLTQGAGRLGGHAASGWLDQPVGKVLLLPSQPLEQPMHVVILRGAQLIPDAPDFFDGAFLLHPSKLPSTRGACKPRGACRLEPSIPRPTSARSWRCGCVGSSKSAENPSHARTQTQYAPHPGLRAVGSGRC